MSIDSPATIATALGDAFAAHEIAVVLGSGWAPAANALGSVRAEIAMSEIPGLRAPVVDGHPGLLRSMDLDGRRLLVFLGRTHLYEGHGPQPVALPVRAAAALGCTTLVVTNAAGSLVPEWTPGTPVLVRDHINLTGTSPLDGPQFVDMSQAYSPRLRALCRQVDPALEEGVYAAVRGPAYETPAEIRMIAAIGGQLVGMSTVLEVIAARSVGMEVLGISMVTNAASGMSAQPLDHAEVLAAGRESAERIGALLGAVIPGI